MHLKSIEIRNFRSLFEEADGAFSIDLSDGLNVMVGRNNCGKSNVLRAVALAMDPQFPFDKTCDLPAQKLWAWPTVTLAFGVPGRTGPEKTLLKYASAYERSVKKGAHMRTYADDGEVHLQVQYSGSGDGYRRTERIKIRGVGGRQGPADEREKVLRQLRSVVNFVLLESGQSLEAMLEGQSREILHGVIRDHLRIFGIGEKQQAEEHDERLLIRRREVFLGECAIAVEPRRHCGGQTRNRLEVHTLTQSDRELRSEVCRLPEDVIEGAVLLQRRRREQEVDVTGAVFGQQREVDLNERLGAALRPTPVSGRAA